MVCVTTGVLWGWLADRWGARWVVAATSLLMGFGVFLSGTSQTLWQLYLFYGIIAGAGLGGMIGPVSALVSRWFDRRRGLAIGISYAGIGAGTAGIPILVGYLNTSYGWRYGFSGLGIMLWVSFLISAALLREYRGLAQSRVLERKARGAKSTSQHFASTLVCSLSVTQTPLRTALHTKSFWIMFFMETAATTIFFMVLVHLVAHSTDSGVSLSTAITFLSVIGAAIIGGQVLGGVLGDRFGPRWIFAGGLMVCTLALVWLSVSNGLWMFYIFAIAFGSGAGAWSPQLPLIIARIFGTRHLGAIWGTVLLGEGIGGISGPIIAGYIFDSTGGYFVAFAIAAAIGIAGVALTLILSDLPYGRHTVRE